MCVHVCTIPLFCVEAYTNVMHIMLTVLLFSVVVAKCGKVYDYDYVSCV